MTYTSTDIFLTQEVSRRINERYKLSCFDNLDTVEPSCDATPFAAEIWPFKRGGLSTGVEINTFVFKFTLSCGLTRRVGILSWWHLQKGFAVLKDE